MRPRLAILAYAVAAAVALLLPTPAKGWGVLAVSFGGCAGLVLLARTEGDREWLAILAVVIPISVLQIFPDWLLSAGLHILRFPDTGGIRVGHAIPLAMGGMWALPLFLIVVIARGSVARGALAALVTFAATEVVAPSLDLWGPTGGVTKVLGVALYVLPAEAALGAATVLAVRLVARAPAGERVLAAAAVSTLYTGALALSWFLIDHATFALSAR
jgi:hypothetical protein